MAVSVLAQKKKQVSFILGLSVSLKMLAILVCTMKSQKRIDMVLKTPVK